MEWKKSSLAFWHKRQWSHHLPHLTYSTDPGGGEEMLILMRSLFWKISNSPAPLFMEERLTNRVWTQSVFYSTRGNLTNKILPNKNLYFLMDRIKYLDYKRKKVVSSCKDCELNWKKIKYHKIENFIHWKLRHHNPDSHKIPSSNAILGMG